MNNYEQNNQQPSHWIIVFFMFLFTVMFSYMVSYLFWYGLEMELMLKNIGEII